MNYQFKTSCQHHGTIKPVKSTTGKHAGKWMCKVKGPSITSQGTNVKTVYTAPFIGASKAAIAKCLKITVSEIMDESHSANAKGVGVSTPVHNTNQKQSNGSVEFGDDDDELANFDLSAAVSSAKKQSPHKSPSNPYHKQKSSSSSSSTPKNETTPKNNERGWVGSTSASFKTNSGVTTKPPQYPKSAGNLKSPYPTAAQASASAPIASQMKDREGLKKELDSLSSEKDRLQREVDLANQEKKRLELDVHSACEEKERLTSESENTKKEKARLTGQIRAMREQYDKLQSDLKSSTQKKVEVEKEGKIASKQKAKLETKAKAANKELDSEKNQLKGQLRAMREQYDQLKSDVKIVNQKKKVAEKEAHMAHEKMMEYEKEAGAAKKTLAAHLADIDNLAKQEANAKPIGESEPPKKKHKTGKKAKNGTIVKSMKVADLKEEAVARGIEVKTLAKINKGELLNMLVEGSTCITKTNAWGEVLRLREQFAKERREAEELQNQRREEMYRKSEKEEKERQEKLKAAREKERTEEISKQAHHHTHHHPKVHSCKLAETSDLQFHGSQRIYNARCSECSHFSTEYTCEKCEFHICQACFKEKTMTPKEKRDEAKRNAALEKKRQEEQAKVIRMREEAEKERRKKWEPKAHFKPKIFDPPDKNLDPDGNKKKGFTVWCSDGYGYDGFHSYEGSPDKEWDSTYATKEDANERARYLFYWKNPWGHEPEHIMEEEEVDKTSKDGLVTYVASPPDSTTWTVSVVPDAAFKYMENARQGRHHGHDEDYGPTAGEMGYRSFF